MRRREYHLGALFIIEMGVEFNLMSHLNFRYSGDENYFGNIFETRFDKGRYGRIFRLYSERLSTSLQSQMEEKCKYVIIQTKNPIDIRC